MYTAIFILSTNEVVVHSSLSHDALIAVYCAMALRCEAEQLGVDWAQYNAETDEVRTYGKWADAVQRLLDKEAQ